MDEKSVQPAIGHPESNSDHSDEKDGIQTIEDVGAKEAGGRGNVIVHTTFTPEEEKRIISKLDWHIMPFIFLLYSLSILDRSNLGNARIAGLEDDINISGNRYTWLATVFYIAYILSQWMQMGWKAFKPHNWVACTVFAWGVISTCQAACTSWPGLMICRVGLGIVEAMFGPGVPLYLSFFYPREKLGLRTGIFISGSALANAYGGALAYGIAQAKGSIGPWRILFIVEGIPTCLVAIACYFLIPDGPDNAYFLKGRDREVAIALALRQPGDRTERRGLIWKQVLGALLDYRSECPQGSGVSTANYVHRLPPRSHLLLHQRLLRLSTSVRADHHL